jgi:hypothetical protein
MLQLFQRKMENWFEELENRTPPDKAKINWPYTLDFKIQGGFMVEDIRSLLQKVKTANDDELLYISQHCFNLISWIDQMGIMGFLGLSGFVDELLEKEFGNKNVIKDLQESSFKKWLSGKQGQYKIGENHYNIYENKIYYRNLQGNWHLVDEKDVFKIMPTLGLSPESTITEELEKDYHPTKYHQIFLEWQNSGFGDEIPKELFTTQVGETTPEEYLQFTIKNIKEIIACPVSYKQIEKLDTKGGEHLEYLIKVGYLMAEFVEGRRKSNQHTVYLLRDCVIFYEIQKTLDLLDGKDTSSDQLIIGRKLLSSKRRAGGHWYVAQEILFHSYIKYPRDYPKFYEEFSRLMKEYAEYSQEFAEVLERLGTYIRKHIEGAIKNNLKIEIVDLGFQGSINVLVKYVIDNYCTKEVKLETEIHMYVLAEWFKTVYGKRYTTETYSMLTKIEDLTRNEYLYDYKPGSFEAGEPMVIMGDESAQRDANVELLVMTMVTILAKRLKII